MLRDRKVHVPWTEVRRALLEARPPYIRRLRTEDARLAGAAQDGMLGTERIQGHHASALRCPDGRQPGSQ